MLSTGDVQGCLRQLEPLLRTMKYPGYVDYNGLSKGDPSAFLPIVSFTLTSFSPLFAKQLMEAGLELTGKTDLRFTDTLYKVLRDIFHYKPILTKQQFLQWGFSQRKISVICDIINLVLQKHNQLKKVSKKPFVVSHIENSKNSYVEEFSSHDDVSSASHNEVYSFNPSGNGIAELAGREEVKENLLYSSEVKGRLSALESQLGSLLSGMDRLSILEKRLEKLNKQRITDKNEGEVITISRDSWENLMSRVLLLETKLDLSNIQLSVPLPCPSSDSSFSCTMPDASKEEVKDRLDRITNMLKSTSSLLKNTESPTTLQIYSHK
ncbi:centrosomal protein of 44 kDa [Clinocottus analis]|uniref:centrosomal protein of 44 kDa n=1 Tax=Clinocottus analis TaxID=304258 RepID=UPI0035C0CE6C